MKITDGLAWFGSNDRKTWVRLGLAVKEHNGFIYCDEFIAGYRYLQLRRVTG